MEVDELLNVVMRAQENFQKGLDGQRQETLKAIEKMEASLLLTFHNAHTQNKESLNKIETILNLQNGRISTLEKWRSGIVAVLLFIVATWSAAMSWLNFWKR